MKLPTCSRTTFPRQKIINFPFSAPYNTLIVVFEGRQKINDFCQFSNLSPLFQPKKKRDKGLLKSSPVEVYIFLIKLLFVMQIQSLELLSFPLTPCCDNGNFKGSSFKEGPRLLHSRRVFSYNYASKMISKRSCLILTSYFENKSSREHALSTVSTLQFPGKYVREFAKLQGTVNFG